MAVFIAVVLIGLKLMMTIQGRSIEKIERIETKTWQLAMNLNPSDGHIMDFATGWTENKFIGTYADALSKDFLDRVVWNTQANFIALVRHQAGEADAVKVFRFVERGRSLLSRFQEMNPGRVVATEGGPIHESISSFAQNLADDPVFSVGGDLAFNWAYTNNGHRIVLTGGHLSAADVNDDGTRGIGNSFYCNPLTGEQFCSVSQHEISIISYPTSDGKYIQGSDHGYGEEKDGPVYGNYAIFVSEDAEKFPQPGFKLTLKVEV